MKKLILLLTIVFFSSCSLFYNTSKYTTDDRKKLTTKKSIRLANKAINSIDYIQAKAKVSFRDNNKIKSNTITLRIDSDDKLWINSSLGAARVLIDTDSIRFYNKIEKNYFVSDYAYINSKLGFDVNFSILQDLILGILINEFKPSDFLVVSDKNYVFIDDNFVFNSKTVKYSVFIDPYTSAVKKQIFTIQDNLFEVLYNDHTKVNGQLIPTKIQFLNNGTESLLIDFKSVSSLEKINIPFRIPSNYKRIKL